MKISIVVFLALNFLWIHKASAESDSKDHVASFSVSVTQSIANDQVTVVFAKHVQASDSVTVIERINDAMTSALYHVRQTANVTFQTGNYSVYPIYQKSKVVAWKGKQTLKVITQDLAKLEGVLQNLQTELSYQSMQFSISRQLQDQKMEGLLTQVTAKFKRRTALMAKAFGARKYQILQTNINEPAIARSYQPRHRMEAMAMSDSVSAPAVAEGKNDLSVTIRGKVKFLY